MISLPCLKPSSDFPLHLEEKLTSLSWFTRPCNLVPASFCDLTSCHMLSMTIPSPMSSLLLCHLRFSAPSKRYECIAPTSMPLRLTYSLVSLNVDSLQTSLSTYLVPLSLLFSLSVNSTFPSLPVPQFAITVLLDSLYILSLPLDFKLCESRGHVFQTSSLNE